MKTLYDDGTEELLEAGDVFYRPAGHMAIVEEDLRIMDFSPAQELDEVMGHPAEVMAQKGG